MNHSILSYKRVIGFTTIAVLVLLTALVASGNLFSQSVTLAPIPVASVAYNAHPGKAVLANAPSLIVNEHDNVAYLTWSDPGVVGVSSVSATITAGGSCATGANWFYQRVSLTYSASKNVDRATSQPIAGRANKGNAYWQYAPGNTYSAVITVTNAAGTSVPSSCVAFVIPQNDPMPAV
jgi:hypothetical protein